MASNDIVALGRKLALEGPHKLEKSPRRVRILFDKKYIVDTQSAHYVWEHPYYPQYYIPLASLEHVSRSSETHYSEGFTTLSLSSPTSSQSLPGCLLLTAGPLQDLLRIPFNSPGLTWFEEDSQIQVHPKDPYKRVDILPSTRNIKVTLPGKDGDVVLAESSNVANLFETGLPTRYYLPPTSVQDWALLQESKTTTKCPYKGEANYYDVVVDGEAKRDLVWYYVNPTSESVAIAGRLCFYNEKVDVWIDGVKQERAVSKFGGDSTKFVKDMHKGGVPELGMSTAKAMTGTPA
ncbi:MAG: hypothetical protein M1820_008238 [Bogoriella megaspora]|nr:MAG: hypothetical protein M1820_008238 [Bogoriella megaspora]